MYTTLTTPCWGVGMFQQPLEVSATLTYDGGHRIAIRMEAIAHRSEAIAVRLEAIASRLEAVAIKRLEAIAIAIIIYPSHGWSCTERKKSLCKPQAHPDS